MKRGSDLEDISQLIIKHIEKKRRRVQEFSPATPTEWRPHAVKNPLTDCPYTDQDAWHLICDTLKIGQSLESVEMRRAKGVTAYSMVIRRKVGGPAIYAKVSLGSDYVLGWSFHEDKPRTGKKRIVS